MTAFRIRNEFAAVDVSVEDVPWGVVLSLTDARTGMSVRLDPLEVEALTTLSPQDREVLVNRSAGTLRRSHQCAETGGAG
jgi:hypothetical protein